MSTETIKLPDIGVSDAVEIIEISVKPGDDIKTDDTLLVLESDKASMDIPAPRDGRVRQILVKEGDKVATGDAIFEFESQSASTVETTPTAAPATDPTPSPAAESTSKPAAFVANDKPRLIDIHVPDLSGSGEVPVIELAVKEGDQVEVDDALITLESDKASMDVPSPYAGRIVALKVKEGDHVSTGDLIGQMEVAASVASDTPRDHDASAANSTETSVSSAAAVPQDEPAVTSEPQRHEIRIPDIGGSEQVPVIEVAIKVGDSLAREDTLITLESDKASMDIPSPFAGRVVELAVKEGDKVTEGDLIGYIETVTATGSAQVAQANTPSSPNSATSTSTSALTAKSAALSESPAATQEPSTEALSPAQREIDSKVHAGPAVRMLARELGVDLNQVKGTGPKSRVLKEDLHGFVKTQLSAPRGSTSSASSSTGIPAMPAIDFAQFGDIETRPMSRLMQAGATNLHRSWLNVPHVTQFDKADITELEAFRRSMKEEAAQEGARLTPLPFMVKACAYALRKFPQFNVSLHPDGDKLIWKHYVHIGIAVDTPDGLMVPVLRNADQKSVTQLALEVADLAKRAQSKQLKRDEMTGGCFTISSLGSIGGTAFTPIVNAPEVAILGVSKAETQPVWDGNAFQPRLMLPLCLSYDHRALNGADGARFTRYLAALLSDIRRLVM